VSEHFNKGRFKGVPNSERGHTPLCNCCVCRARRHEALTHRDNCMCCICKAKRHEQVISKSSREKKHESLKRMWKRKGHRNRVLEAQQQAWKKKREEKYSKKGFETLPQMFCLCGCGEITNPGKKFIYNHYTGRIKKEIFETIPQQYCKCGCGELCLPGNRYFNISHASRRPCSGETKRKIGLAIMDKEFFQQHGTLKSLYPYNKCFNGKLAKEILERDNYTCQVTGMTNKEHVKQYGCRLHIHHWTYNKNESNPYYFVTVTHSINSLANSWKDRAQWTDMFNGIMEEKYCEMLTS